ncbi:MAG: zinc-dependent metalloprotease [Longimicrobiales bacterium]|nr:zinc-dependent metalloprotease [Longimicrobiales bacterium]
MNLRVELRALALVSAFAFLGCGGTATTAAPSAGPTPEAGAQTPTRPGGGQRPGGQEASGPKPYEEVITEDAVTQEGLFSVHRIDEKLLFEIPTSGLYTEMLLIGRPVESTTQDPGGFFGGGARLIVQWERQGNRIVLRDRRHNLVADSTDAIWRQVSGFRQGAVLATFNIEAFGADSAAVIDVSDLFLSNIPELDPIDNINRGRSWVDQAWAFPENINVEVTQSGQTRPSGGPGGGGGPPGFPGFGGPQGPTSQTVKMHFSMLKLPDDPMMPRWHDERVGFISSRAFDLSSEAHRTEQKRFIHRFRLEKQNPNAEISDPVEPIIYWIDPATPDWLKPWIVEGVNKWQPAFEDAGFSNAIFGRVAPTPEEDPDFSLFDARHSAIYWRPSTVANATGGQIVDPRTGEILKGEVNMYHNIMELLKNWYFIQVSPLDERAQSLPLPDSLMGRLVEYVVTHEIGHSIGFPHNMKASAQFPVDSIRNADFLERMNGHVATLMDYSRFNYVAQPEDNIPPHLLIPNVGPYDHFAVKWGYTPIPEARTPDDEKAQLDEWAREQDQFPWLRFSTPDASQDPEDLTEAVGDADAVRANTLGMRNLERVVEMLIPVAETPGESYDELETLYAQAVGQWGRYMGHVAAIVGGAYTQETYGRGPRFEPVEKARQREAVEFLNRTAFVIPEMFLNDEILRRIENDGVVERFRDQQARVLTSLFSQARLERLAEFEALADTPAEAYTLADLMTDLRGGVWGELSQSNVRIDVYRRNVQRAFLNAVDRRLHPTEEELTRRFNPASEPWVSDVRGVMRAELEDLDRLAEQALPRAADAMTRIHLRDIRSEIARILSVD